MNVFRSLLSQAQFHGSRRLLVRKYRNWWAVMLALCLWASSSITFLNTRRFFENPAFILVSEPANYSMEFPSVIVCPEVEYPDYKIEEFLTDVKYPSGMNKSEIKLIIQQLAAFYSPDVNYSTADLKKIETFLAYNNLDIGPTSARLTVTCEETVIRCRFFGIMLNCSSIFQLELTNFGYCCIFNGRSLRREMSQKTIPPPAIVVREPKEPSFSNGLMFVVNSSQKLGDIDLTYDWLYLEEGLQFAECGTNGTPIVPNTEVWISYHSHRFIIDDEARTLSPELRQCVMSTKKLTYFPSYSRKYCVIECEMRRTLERCGCVRFAHPRLPQWKYCDAQMLLCAKNSVVPFGVRVCGCLPTCDRKLLTVKRRIIPMTSGSFIIDPFYDDLDFTKVAVVRAYILHHHSKIFTRSSFFTSMNLFAQIGGTINVFFGCSILTMAELAQLIWYAYRQRKTGKQNRNQKLKLPASKKEDSVKKKSSQIKKVNFKLH